MRARGGLRAWWSATSLRIWSRIWVSSTPLSLASAPIEASQQVAIQIRPMDQYLAGILGSSAPQVRHPPAHHQKQPIGVEQQTVAQEVSGLDRSGRLVNQSPRRRRSGRQTAGIAP